jgi:hypothetical protein
VIDGKASLILLVSLVAAGVALMGFVSIPYLIREWDTVMRKGGSGLSEPVRH